MAKGLIPNQKGFFQQMNNLVRTPAAQTASIAAGGNLKVELDISNYVNSNKELFIHGMDVFSSASVDFAVEIYTKTAQTAKTFITRYESETIGGVIVIKDNHIKPIYYKDDDGTSKLFMKIINTDSSNASTFTHRVTVSDSS